MRNPVYNHNNKNSSNEDYWSKVSSDWRELCNRKTRITFTEYTDLRGNSWEQKIMIPNLSNEALIAHTDNCIKNIFGHDSDRFEINKSYEDQLVACIVPTLLDRIVELEGKYQDALYKHPSNYASDDGGYSSPQMG